MIERLRSMNGLFTATTIAIICRICLAVFTYGTNDASMWESSAALIRETGGRSIYNGLVEVREPQGKLLHEQIFNHPPLIIRLLQGMNALKTATGIPVRVSIRLLDTAADACTVVLTTAILRNLLGSIPVWPMLLVAIAPSWIFISGFHANTDPLMLFFLVLAVYLIDVRGLMAWGALAFAFATGIKVVPILLLPTLLLWLNGWRDRFRALLILAAFWLVTAIPWMIDSPRDLARNLLGYRSLTGHWGIGMLLAMFNGSLAALFNSYGLYVLAVALVTTAWLMNRGGTRAALFCEFGFLLFLFILLTPGFGIQYLAWLTPWVAVLPWRVAATHIAASSAFCAVVYTYWSGGLPWYYANSVATGTWRGGGALLGLWVWLTVLMVVNAYWRRQLLKPVARSPR